MVDRSIYYGFVRERILVILSLLNCLAATSDLPYSDLARESPVILSYMAELLVDDNKASTTITVDNVINLLQQLEEVHHIMA